MILGWGLCIIVVLAAIQGAEGWEHGQFVSNSFRNESKQLDAGLHLGTNGRLQLDSNPLKGSILDETPTMALPTDAPEMDEGDTAADVDVRQPDAGQYVLSDVEMRVVENEQMAHPACGSVWSCFFWGYYGADGQYPTERIDAMIQCESSWRIDPGGYHLGLAQFDPGTWWTVSAITGLPDWLDPYQQGYNVAVWSWMVSPGTTAGWPSCWWAWGY